MDAIHVTYMVHMSVSISLSLGKNDRLEGEKLHNVLAQNIASLVDIPCGPDDVSTIESMIDRAEIKDVRTENDKIITSTWPEKT